MAEPYDFSPACWDWPPPGEADRERLAQRFSPRVIELAGPSLLMLEWQQGRCAACGCLAGDALVEDHDHQTGMTRGYLCRSCNTREGMNRWTGYRLWREYRERNPASICGAEERYWNPWTQEFAEPEPPPWSDADRWARNPMRNAGL